MPSAFYGTRSVPTTLKFVNLFLRNALAVLCWGRGDSPVQLLFAVLGAEREVAALAVAVPQDDLAVGEAWHAVDEAVSHNLPAATAGRHLAGQLGELFLPLDLARPRVDAATVTPPANSTCVPADAMILPESPGARQTPYTGQALSSWLLTQM